MESTIPIGIQWPDTIFSMLAGGILTIAGFVYALYRWGYGPKFRVGVPPSHQERQLKNMPLGKVGKLSITSQFRHKGIVFARQLKEKEKLTPEDINTLFNDTNRCRTVFISPEMRVSLPIIVENYGRRAAQAYVLGISFLNPGVHIVDVTTEGAEIGTIYCNDPESLKKNGHSGKLVGSDIIAAYDNYMDLGSEYGDMIFLGGPLDGWMYEMSLIEVSLDKDVERFIVGFTLNWTDGFTSPVRQKVFFQGFVVSEM